MSTDDSKRIGSPRLAWTGATLLVTGLAMLGIAASPATSTTTTAPTTTPSSSSASVPSSASTTPSTTPSSSSSAATGTTDPDGTPLLGPDGEPLELDDAGQALAPAVPGRRTAKASAATAAPIPGDPSSVGPADDEKCRDALGSGGNLPVTSPDGFTKQGGTAVVFGGDWWEDYLLGWRRSLYVNPANDEAWQSLRTICFDAPVKSDQRWSSFVSVTWPTSASGRRLTTVGDPVIYVGGNKGQEGPGWTHGFFADNRIVSWEDTPQPIAQFTGKGFQPYAVFMYVQAARDTVPDIYHSVVTYSFVID